MNQALHGEVPRVDIGLGVGHCGVAALLVPRRGGLGVAGPLRLRGQLHGHRRGRRVPTPAAAESEQGQQPGGAHGEVQPSGRAERDDAAVAGPVSGGERLPRQPLREQDDGA
eukprot:CAMPEP_0177361498 /NCGR_PEP_ID=MMETSP0368-20130122/37213_1 /TAXON_ID=447022 ORGANISM="Scrippsiella hangoei-like, Strain SHHI-4" /NCGR_SAMPLE_ID=MMETSP0368 /ASSEMBLY_ACC=CAM_ASM_000363 /LENGTH=111 /DNA_ID=CAMNT_0018824145 /DNA_START=123 /DNA_END=458 /DNA_ORIENTATION=+